MYNVYLNFQMKAHINVHMNTDTYDHLYKVHLLLYFYFISTKNHLS